MPRAIPLTLFIVTLPFGLIYASTLTIYKLLTGETPLLSLVPELLVRQSKVDFLIKQLYDTTDTLFPQNAPYDESIKVDPTSVLPVEIMQQILSHLPPGAYLTTKFVSRSFYATTLRANGCDLRGFRGTRDVGDPDRKIYIHTVITLEGKHLGPPLDLLTCYGCGKRLGISVVGFDDATFVQAAHNRRCLTCQIRCLFTVNGVEMARCYSCDRYVFLEDRVSGNGEYRAMRRGHRCRRIWTS
jgi:hypothetical protein